MAPDRPLGRHLGPLPRRLHGNRRPLGGWRRDGGAPGPRWRPLTPGLPRGRRRAAAARSGGCPLPASGRRSGGVAACGCGRACGFQRCDAGRTRPSPPLPRPHSTTLKRSAMKINGNEDPSRQRARASGLAVGGLWKVQHVKPGKGGAIRSGRLKNLIDGRKAQRALPLGGYRGARPPGAEGLPVPHAEGDDLVFMDSQTYEQISLSSDFVGVARGLPAGRHDRDPRDVRKEKPIGITLPQHVTLEIAEADAGGERGRRRHRATSPPCSRTASR